MAVRINASGESYSRSNPLGTGARSIALWFRIASDRNIFTAMVGIDSAGANYEFLGFTSDGTTVGYDINNNPVGFTTSCTVGTWYFAAGTYDGGTSAAFHLAAVGDAALATATGGVTAPPGGTLFLGNDGFDEWFDGDLANVRLWDAQLSTAEIERERWTIVPHRTTNLVGWYPFLEASTVDLSGAGNSLTANGSPTSTGEHPPTPWRPARPRLLLPPAAAGGSTVPLHVLGRGVPYSPWFQGAR